MYCIRYVVGLVVLPLYVLFPHHLAESAQYSFRNFLTPVSAHIIQGRLILGAGVGVLPTNPLKSNSTLATTIGPEVSAWQMVPGLELEQHLCFPADIAQLVQYAWRPEDTNGLLAATWICFRRKQVWGKWAKTKKRKVTKDNLGPAKVGKRANKFPPLFS